MRFTCCCSSTGFLHKKKVNNPLLQHLYRTFVEKVQKNLQITILFVPLHSLLKGKHIGELAEWSNAAVLKTVDLNGSGGSNPSLSAKHNEKSRQACLNAIFLLCFASPRRRRGGMCERSEQIPESVWSYNLAQALPFHLARAPRRA